MNTTLLEQILFDRLKFQVIAVKSDKTLHLIWINKYDNIGNMSIGLKHAKYHLPGGVMYCIKDSHINEMCELINQHTSLYSPFKKRP